MNWDILGHEWAVSLLKEHIAQGGLRHAYLLTGPQGVGRRTLALRMAQALNCLQPPTPGEPCGTCRICKQIGRMEHPDLAVEQAEQVGGILKVDQIRDLQRSLSLAPYDARYRVALLLRFEEANPNAANALLKTLEEPPPQVIMMVTADSPESLLPTIVSRCEVVRLRPLPLEQVRQDLQRNWGLPEEEAKLLAHISGGRPGYALHLHQEPERMAQRISWLEEHNQMLSANRVQRFAYAETLAKDKDTLRSVLLVWISLWRDVLLCAAGSSSPLANLDRADEIGVIADRFGVEAAHQTIARLEHTLDLLDRNANTRLTAEVMLLDLPIFRN
jgi:DNA polymerase III subunit delta'